MVVVKIHKDQGHKTLTRQSAYSAAVPSLYAPHAFVARLCLPDQTTQIREHRWEKKQILQSKEEQSFSKKL